MRRQRGRGERARARARALGSARGSEGGAAKRPPREERVHARPGPPPRRAPRNASTARRARRRVALGRCRRVIRSGGPRRCLCARPATPKDSRVLCLSAGRRCRARVRRSRVRRGRVEVLRGGVRCHPVRYAHSRRAGEWEFVASTGGTYSTVEQTGVVTPRRWPRDSAPNRRSGRHPLAQHARGGMRWTL